MITKLGLVAASAALANAAKLSVQPLCPSDCPVPECQNGGEAVCFTKYVKTGFYYQPVNDYKCECAEGFEGDLCEINNPCVPNPCKRHTNRVEDPFEITGTCERNGDDFVCNCDAAHRLFFGKLCHLQDICAYGDICLNGGKCSMVEEIQNGIETADFHCACPDDYTGKNCESLIPSEHSGSSPAPTEPALPIVCEPYTCGHGTCHEVDGKSFWCNCPENVTGKTCDTPLPCFYGCGNNGTCTNIDDETKLCECPTGFSGYNCEIEDPCHSKPCHNEGVCSTNPADFPGNGCGKGCDSDYVCKCPEGFLGKRCEQVDQCFLNPCQNGARCFNQDCGSSRICDCKGTGFIGENCDEKPGQNAETQPATTTTEKPTTTVKATTLPPTITSKPTTTQKATSTLQPTTTKKLTTVAPTTKKVTTLPPTTPKLTTATGLPTTTAAATTVLGTTPFGTTTPLPEDPELDPKEVEETKHICHNHPFNLLFVVDGSGSVGPKRFRKSLSFLKNIVSVLDVSNRGAHVAMVQFSFHVRTEFSWTHDYQRIYRKVDKVEYYSKTTKTGKALRFATTEVIPLLKRTKVPTVVMVLTDGKSNDRNPDDYLDITAPMLKENVDAVFAIGVGKADINELNTIASEPSSHHVYNSNSWSWLKSINMEIAKKLCTANKKTQN